MRLISVTATPGKLADELQAALEAEPEDAEAAASEGEREQLAAAAKAADDLAPLVSKRERVLVTISGHDRPGTEGFNPRHLTVTISRINPEGSAR